MAVELEGRTGPSAVESHRDRRGGRMPPIEALHIETVGREQVRESVAHGPGIAGGTGHFDQLQRRLDQPPTADMDLEAFDDPGCRIHDEPL